MGLYDDRLSDLSEPRRVRGVASPRLGPRPFVASSGSPIVHASKKPMRVQSLLFGAGWTEAKAKSWAKSHGYKHGKVDVTDQYIRIRQFDPKGLKVKRTITLGRGIRAVVAREETMKRRAKAKAPSRRRRARKSPVAAKPVRRKRRRAVKEAAPRRRRRSSLVMEAKRPRKRRRAKRRTVRAWRGDSAGHRKAAKKGHRRRKARRHVAREVVAAPRKRRRAKRRSRKHVYAAAPRRRRSSRRRRHHTRETPVVHAKRRRSSRRRRHSMFAKRSGGGSGMSGTQFAVALGSAGLGFIAADALDRFLATYDPAGTGDKPKDKFTSDGAGTLANTLNLAATPNLYRIGAGVGMTALPAVASMFVSNPLVRSSLEGFAIGSGVKLLALFWNNVVMGHLLKPKDTSPAALQKNIIARLYPAEIAASINQSQTPPNLNGAAAVANGSLSGGQGVDVGPFALQGSSEYPDAAQALRQQAGVHGEFPTLQNVWGTGAYPTATQAMHPLYSRHGVGADAPVATGPVAVPVPTQAIVPAPQAYQPGPPTHPGPGPQVKPHADCGCIGESNQFLGFVEEKDEKAA